MHHRIAALLIALHAFGAARARTFGVEFDIFPVDVAKPDGGEGAYWTAGAGSDGADGDFDYAFWTKVYRSAAAVLDGGALADAPESAAARASAPVRALASRADLEALFTPGPDRRAKTGVLLALYDADDAAADEEQEGAPADGSDGGGGGGVWGALSAAFGGGGGNGADDDDGAAGPSPTPSVPTCRRHLDAAWVTWAKRWTGPTLVDVATARKRDLGSSAFLSTLVAPAEHENALHRNCSAVLHWARGAPLRGGAALCGARRCATPHGFAQWFVNEEIRGTEVVVHNAWHRELSVSWCNEGKGQTNEEEVFRLKPGERRRVQSTVSHVFSARDAGGGRAGRRHGGDFGRLPLVTWFQVAGPGEVDLRPRAPRSPERAAAADVDGGGGAGAGDVFVKEASCGADGTCVARTGTAAADALEAELLRSIYDLWYYMRQVGMVTQVHVVPPITRTGFAKRRIPEDLFRAILAFYRGAKAVQEGWQGAALNQYHSPTTVRHLPARLKQRIYDEMRTMHARWVGPDDSGTLAGPRGEAVELVEKSLYGIRSYHKHAVLRMHLDTAHTHIVSSIIHVANDLKDGERWPLYIYAHDGTLHKVDFEPGDIVHYESARAIHGRPEALPGDEYANLFLHYQPAGWEAARPELDACMRTM